MKRPLTAIIPTYNEIEHIEAAIRSVDFADEILVVDSYSTDGTAEKASQLGARLIQREYKYSASQKNWAIPQASHEWVFLLDADERVPDALRTEILDVLSKEKIDADSFWIKRKNWFLGKEVKHSGWNSDKVIRLFKQSCRYEDKKVHAEIIDPSAGWLKNNLEHHTASSLSNYLKKWDQYSTWSAEDRFKKGVKPGLWHFTIRPFWKFFHRYFIRLGILDGWTGLVICSLDAGAVWMRYVKLWGMWRKQNQ